MPNPRCRDTAGNRIDFERAILPVRRARHSIKLFEITRFDHFIGAQDSLRNDLKGRGRAA